MSISSIPPNTASAITPFNPLGRNTVGEEEKDSKNSTLKAVEESAQSARGSLRREGAGKDDKVEAIKDEKEERREQQQQKEELRDRRQEQIKPSQAEAEPRVKARKKTTAGENNIDSQRANDRQNRPINQEANQRLAAINRRYLDVDDLKNRPGSIVSEAV